MIRLLLLPLPPEDPYLAGLRAKHRKQRRSEIARRAAWTRLHREFSKGYVAWMEDREERRAVGIPIL